MLDVECFEAGPAERARFFEALRWAARDVEFFYISGQGIDPALHRDLLALSRCFVDLPQAAKHAIDIAVAPHFRG